MRRSHSEELGEGVEPRSFLLSGGGESLGTSEEEVLWIAAATAGAKQTLKGDAPKASLDSLLDKELHVFHSEDSRVY
ncbi:hypothetical protein FOZ63_030239 [Perkinsus olseni]|uniref:Uncharacterized protein n=1 Tax=Perkinsus olseni TaxID=32597 RepID=A0A7J6N5Q4_PEROL|nr:hypothetical protein FOZ63_030239 [Perkinsus olseni]KAF4742282.1 hypothetical protein FOZ62_001002 [Perkinsus olseni]